MTMQYPRHSPINPYYPLQKKHADKKIQPQFLNTSLVKQQSVFPSTIRSNSRRTSRSISPYKIVQKIYLQNDPHNPIKDRIISIPKELNKSITKQLNNRFTNYKQQLSSKYNKLMRRTQNLTQTINKSYLKQDQSTILQQNQQILLGCF